MITIRATIRNRRIDVPAPSENPDGTEVILTMGTSKPLEDEPVSPEEIASVLAAMQTVESLEIPDDVAADLDAWERKVNQHGISHQDVNMEELFR